VAVAGEIERAERDWSRGAVCRPLLGYRAGGACDDRGPSQGVIEEHADRIIQAIRVERWERSSTGARMTHGSERRATRH
jgi:hypothetical protein